MSATNKQCYNAGVTGYRPLLDLRPSRKELRGYLQLPFSWTLKILEER